MTTKSRKSRKIAKTNSVSFNQVGRLVLSVFILAMLLAQLFTFEKLSGLLVGAGVPSCVGLLISSLLVAIELSALPYLLKMNTHGNVIRISKICGFITLSALSVLETMAIVNNSTSVLFGATASLPGGLWAIFFLAALWILLLKINFTSKNSAKSSTNSQKSKRKKTS